MNTNRMRSFALYVTLLSWLLPVMAATVVPNEVKMPGTQPAEVSNLQTADRCDNCHGGYNTAVEPAHNWRGSMMAHAGRDPIFWATMAIAEQSFDGSGDLCLRCHSASGWLAGRSTPTDGSALSTTNDSDGVECDLCHRMTNPDNTEHLGVQNAPFIANRGGGAGTGHYGSGQYSMWSGSEKLGPYNDATARHQSMVSQFHRKAEFCGTCHDVSNPVTGDLAPGNGTELPLATGTYSGTLGTAVETKAAFNHFPYAYGVVERTFSEHQSSAFANLRVSDYATLPVELKAGSIKEAYDAAQAAGRGGDYADGTTRLFTCQSCHMRPVTGQGCNKNPAIRPDLPLHDLTGGNYWMPQAIQWLDARGQLRLGGGLLATTTAAMNDGVVRAKGNLRNAAALTVSGDTVRVVNLTGHKLISGYPEGRRMWLNIKWYDGADTLLREDGAYGTLTVNINGASTAVATLLDLSGTNTRIYEAHGAITQEWAQRLINVLGAPAGTPVSFDRITGAVDYTLGDIAAQPEGTYRETFHFVLNNKVVKDNRIPPYGLKYDTARIRNALPFPATQYGDPGAGGTYQYWDTLTLNPPAGAVYANVDLLYQPTSWEYIQFLYRANTGSVVFLANEGNYLRDAWLNTGMAAPFVMASATWGAPPPPPSLTLRVDALTTHTVVNGLLSTAAATFRAGDSIGIRAHVIEAAGTPESGASVSIVVRNAAGQSVKSLSATSDSLGNADAIWKTARRGTALGNYTAVITAVGKSGYLYDAGASVTSVAFTIQ